MLPRTLFVFFSTLLYTSIFAQEKFTTVKNLRSEWVTFEDGSYRPLGEVPFTGLNTIYFTLDPASVSGNFLLLQSDKPYFVFVNGKVVAEFRGRVVLDFDSLARAMHSAAYRIAIHQNRINERGLRTEVVTRQQLVAREEGVPARPYSFFRDFVVIAGLIIILFFLLLYRLHPKLAADYFSFYRIVSSREADDSQASARLTSSSNVQFYILGSIMIGYYLLIVLYNLPAQYALPIHFHATGFWAISWQWLKISAIVFMALLVKLSIVFLLTRLFGFRGMARYHFFNWVRLLLVVFGLATVLVFMYFISRGDSPGVFAFFLSLVVVALTAWIALAFFKLSGRSGHSMFHLFSYLCATEIIPLLITVKVLFE